jgi:hypothetical protein
MYNYVIKKSYLISKKKYFLDKIFFKKIKEKNLLRIIK